MSDTKQDMHEYIDHTRRLVEQGEHAEAMERMIWFHNHALEHSPSMYGVRLSFALLFWLELGKDYPPALDALKKIRDDKTKLLESGKGDSELFSDVDAINQYLGENSRTVGLFRKLDKDYPALAKKCWRVAKRPVVLTQNYDLAQKYFDNIASELDETIDLYREISKAKHYDDKGKEFNDNHFVEGALALIDTAIGIGECDAAKEIQTKALKIVNDERLHNAVS